MTYHVWTDGSATSSGSEMGAGWVIRDEQGAEREYSSPLLEPRHGSSDIAEIMAVALALLCVPENSEVVVHTDSHSVMSHFNARSHASAHANHADKREKLFKALTEMYMAVSRHRSVQFEKTYEDLDPLLERAHHRAREASEETARHHTHPSHPASCHRDFNP